MSQKGAVKGKHWLPRRTELLWQIRRDAAEAEIARLQEEDPTKPWIAVRQMALSNILANLSHAERLELDAEVTRIGREGNTEEEKQR
jgi:hypothetical protein